MDEQEKNAREDTWPSQKMPGILLQYYLKLMEIEQCKIYMYIYIYTKLGNSQCPLWYRRNPSV